MTVLAWSSLARRGLIAHSHTRRWLAGIEKPEKYGGRIRAEHVIKGPDAESESIRQRLSRMLMASTPIDSPTSSRCFLRRATRSRSAWGARARCHGSKYELREYSTAFWQLE